MNFKISYFNYLYCIQFYCYTFFYIKHKKDKLYCYEKGSEKRIE